MCVIAPKFLLAKPENYGITQIQSHYTWLRYLPEDESMFSIAQKLQLDVVKAMVPHYLKELQDAQKRKDEPNITQLENAWIMRMSTEKEQKVLREGYTEEFLLPLIKALSADTTIQLTWPEHPETKQYVGDATIENASKVVQEALKRFRENLFKPKALKDCIDIYQLLIAAYDSCDKYAYTLFQNRTQRNIYGIWVIGLIESLVEPSIAKILCYSAYDVVYNNRQISAQAQSFKLRDGRLFYRSHPDLESGLGFTFICAIHGWPALEGHEGGCGRIIEKVCQWKAADIKQLTEQVQRCKAQAATKQNGL